MAKKTKTEEAMKQDLVVQINEQSQLAGADHTLIHIEDPHYKFYQIKVVDNMLHICYGKIGSSGNHSVTEHYDNYVAKLEADKLLRSKTKKGYEEPVAAEHLVKSKTPAVKKKMSAEGLEKLDLFLNSIKL